MADSRKRRFRFSARRLVAGAQGDDVRALQTFLTETGYLRRDRDPGTMCSHTCCALMHFQKCYGLPDTGEADDATLGLIERPRCGVPDFDPMMGTGSGPAQFVLRGCKYNRTNLTYAFVNSTADLQLGRQREIIREAFAMWSSVSSLGFREVAPNASTDFPISFERQNHGDGSAFDDGGINGNVLAHAFFPPPCGGPFAGALHFDEFESWSDGATAGSIRLLNVAIHEIGHLLGLDHSNTRDAIMFAFYDDAVDRLRQDDINGIQELYGRPSGPASITGQLSGAGASQLHRIMTQPGPLIVRLKGPVGVDFDLYVRSSLPPTRTMFDARGFTGSANEEVRLLVPGGDVFILADSWRGSGPYEIEVV